MYGIKTIWKFLSIWEIGLKDLGLRPNNKKLEEKIMKTLIKYAGISVAAGLLCANASAGTWKNDAAGGFSMNNLYVPSTTSPVGEGRSLLIVLHGCVQPISSYKTANLEKAAEEYGMVVSVPDAKNKAGYSCWSYWQGTKSRSAGDYKNVINLAKEYMNRSEMDIDPNQVYVAGLSSGGAFAMTVGCLAPDIFAGMGLAAAPSAGTSSNGAFSQESSASQITSRCKSYAGSYASDFATQVASTGFGTGDYTVPQGYGLQNANAMASVYGVTKLPGTTTIEGKAVETLWDGPDGKNQVSMLKFNGVSHAWPGGSGASGSYIDGSNINYAMYLGEYFAKNNLRVEDIPDNPYQAKISGTTVDAPEGGSSATITGTVEVPAVSTLRSIAVTVDNQTETVTGTSINKIFNVSQGDHTVAIVVTVDGDDGEEYVTEYNSTFNNETVVEIPSWCVYIPAEYWHYVPQCAPGL